MNDNEIQAVEPVEDNLVDEDVERLMDRADASGELRWRPAASTRARLQRAGRT
ncbi:hypothetical protein ABT124_27370 [Streptomyces sp. NPDC001982]|uniref:hypothetical protein n=1 Tax=unclassified Streptomyces TaxID=2593676 RepID=UPI003330A6F2